uniref:Uncharacterized protein n=1 Tax=Octopus bimaculoides TaxID=37653 RepID=A0A0L8GEZ3_OCTBM
MHTYTHILWKFLIFKLIDINDSIIGSVMSEELEYCCCFCSDVSLKYLYAI